MATKKQSANDARQPKAIVSRTKEDAIKLHNELVNMVNIDEWLNNTKNGALKYTTAIPQLKEDNKGSVKVGGVTFYLVSSGTTKTAIEISFRSYLVYLLKRQAIADKLANFPTFKDWCEKNKSLFANAEILTGVKPTEENKLKMYESAKAKLGTLDEENDEE